MRFPWFKYKRPMPKFGKRPQYKYVVTNSYGTGVAVPINWIAFKEWLPKRQCVIWLKHKWRQFKVYLKPHFYFNKGLIEIVSKPIEADAALTQAGVTGHTLNSQEKLNDGQRDN